MASAYRCDRCNNYYQHIGSPVPEHCVCRAISFAKAGIKLDLCPYCSKDLDDWMDGKAILMRPIPENSPEYVERPENPEYIERLEYPADEVDDE